MSNAKKINNVCVVQNSVRTLWNFRSKYITEIINRGCTVYCLAPMDDQLAADNLTALGVSVITVKSRNLVLNAISMNCRMILLLFKLRFRCLVIAHFVSTIALLFPSLLFSSKTICFIEGLGTFLMKGRTRQKVFKVLLRSVSDLTIFMNRDEKGILGRPSDIVLNGIGVDLDVFSPVKPSSEDTQRDNEEKPIKLLFGSCKVT